MCQVKGILQEIFCEKQKSLKQFFFKISWQSLDQISWQPIKFVYPPNSFKEETLRQKRSLNSLQKVYEYFTPLLCNMSTLQMPQLPTGLYLANRRFLLFCPEVLQAGKHLIGLVVHMCILGYGKENIFEVEEKRIRNSLLA